MLWHRSSQNKNFSETNIAFFGTAAKIKTASFDQKIIFQISPRFDAGIDFFTSTGVSNSLWMCLQYPSQNPPHSINLGVRQLNAESRTKTGINSAHLLKPSRNEENDGNEGS